MAMCYCKMAASETKREVEWSELLRYFGVVYLKTPSATEQARQLGNIHK